MLQRFASSYSRSAVTSLSRSAYTPLSCQRRHKSIKVLVRQYGFPLAVYYLCLNEACVLLITYLLHYEILGTGDIVCLLERVGLESYVDVRGFGETSKSVLGLFDISGRLVMNFGIATAFMSLWTPVQLPFCVATIPTILRWMGRSPKGGAAAAVVAEASVGNAGEAAAVGASAGNVQR